MKISRIDDAIRTLKRIPIHRDNFEHLKNAHKGETCLVIGNGPSLANVPNSFLEKYTSFGSNGIFLKFIPTYYACMDSQDIRRLREDIIKLPCVKFTEESAKIPGCYKIRQFASHGEFSYTPSKALWGGYTVTFTILQICYFMGFSTILLVGVDHRYIIKQNQYDVLSLGDNEDDPDHFCPEYHRGAHFNNPNTHLTVHSYELARAAYQQDGRKIINLTENSALDVFPKGTIAEW